jgi:hypothetical protein
MHCLGRHWRCCVGLGTGANYRRGSPLLPRITASPSVIGRLAMMLFVHELLHRRASHRNNRRPHHSFGIDGPNTVPLGFLPKFFEPVGGVRGAALLLPR